MNKPLTEGKTRGCAKDYSSKLRPLIAPPSGTPNNTSDETVFKVFDTELKEYWRSIHNKKTWATSAAAKNAWNGRFATKYGEPSFNAQSRFITHEYSLTFKTAYIHRVKK